MHLTNNIVLSTHRTNTQYDVSNIFQIEVLAKVSNDDRMANISTFFKKLQIWECGPSTFVIFCFNFNILNINFKLQSVFLTCNFILAEAI